jgi:hypothetical protein
MPGDQDIQCPPWVMRSSSPIFPSRVRRFSKLLTRSMGEPEVFNHHVLDCGTRCHCDLRQRRLNKNLGHLRPSEAVLLLILSKDLNGAQRLNDLNVWNKPKVIQSDAAGTWQSEAAISTQKLPAELRLRLPAISLRPCGTHGLRS